MLIQQEVCDIAHKPSTETKKGVERLKISCSMFPSPWPCHTTDCSTAPKSAFQLEFPRSTLRLCRSPIVSFIPPNTGIGSGCSDLSGGQITHGKLGFLINSRVDIVPSLGAPASFTASIPPWCLPFPTQAPSSLHSPGQCLLWGGQQRSCRMDKKSKMQAEKVTIAQWHFCTRISVGAQH